MSNSFAGIDYSMTCPAITVYVGKPSEMTYEKCKSFFYHGKPSYNKSFDNVHGFIHSPWSSQQERFDNISDWAIAILKKYNVKRVCLEGYSMGSKGLVFNIAENTGLLKHKMFKEGIEFITPAPTEVKRFFSGKGNSKKEQMYETFCKETGVDLCERLSAKASDSPISDVVDSYAMLKFLLAGKE